MKGPRWNHEEYRQLLRACNVALSDVSGGSLMRWPTRLRSSIHEHFYEGASNSTKQRSSKALTDQVYIFIEKFKQMQAIDREASRNSQREGGHASRRRGFRQLDNDVVEALTQLNRNHPGCIVPGPQSPGIRSRQQWSWTANEMELLARAIKASASADDYYQTFLELGGRQRSVNSVRAAANSMLLVRNHVLTTCGSWQNWLQQSERERQGNSKSLPTAYQQILRNMNRNIFRILDEVVNSQRAGANRNEDTTPSRVVPSDQSAPDDCERADDTLGRSGDMGQVNVVNEQLAREPEQTASQTNNAVQGQNGSETFREASGHTPREQLLLGALLNANRVVAAYQVQRAERSWKQSERWEDVTLMQATRQVSNDAGQLAHCTGVLTRVSENLKNRLALLETQHGNGLDLAENAIFEENRAIHCGSTES